MKHFTWNDEKNERLLNDRGVSFEAVVFHIERGDLLDVVEHPNQEKYRGQRMFIINIENYAFLVPFIESDVGADRPIAPTSRDHHSESQGDEKIP